LVVDSGAFICRSFIGKGLAMIVATFTVPVAFRTGLIFPIKIVLKNKFSACGQGA
jgi:hypothetical protein